MTFGASAPPSRNPTNDGHARGAFNVILQKFLQGKIDDMIPAKVVAYNRTTNMASVQPLISMVTTMNDIVPRAQIASVPVLQIGGGGFVLNFPIQPDDLGWLKSNDVDISLFKQLWKMVIPNTGRMHNFSDGIFIPSILTGFTIQSEDAANVVLQNLAGTVRVAIWGDQVKVTAPTVIIDAPTTTITCTNATINCTTTTINGDAHITGNLQVDGNTTAGTGGGAVDLINHVHINAGGTGNSGPPLGGS
jgi:hypothetical protein